MIVNSGVYQISQSTDQDHVKIFRNGKLIRTVSAKPGLKYEELVKILKLYTE